MADEKFSIKIKPEAKAVIEKQMDADHQIVILALDDGSTKYSKKGGTCTIGDSFKFVTLAKADPDYNIKIANDAGLDLYTAQPETTYFEPGLVLNARASTLSLSSDSGIIDGGVTVSQYEPEKVTAEDLKNGGQC
ncbi:MULTISPECIES: iron-sulfur cluster biosynthesis family protein [Lactobacillus]|uniref:Iron-sulfur cluster biosynthesis family protein n=1 Tax=Lactobacillus xujianguonis TaxID=2495899 RepID=A0A437SW75_9LACO|nr:MULTISPECIES: iron-sulfur cluster biosynthesis family protein [Lactobacillus]RVU71077.1 iron-sulfur cluster biosynthesis family protein [Lactobacillus xujianguonis]RVU76767.1 iron-sulfur cluster biosynthesis family protein [Lactobacillus xujianguonis]